MVRILSVALGVAVLCLACSVDTAWAKGKKGGGGAAIPEGYSKIDSVDATAKTFKLAGDAKTYKFADGTTHKDWILPGAYVKLTLKEGSADEVTAVDSAPVGGKAKGKGKKKKDK